MGSREEAETGVADPAGNRLPDAGARLEGARVNIELDARTVTIVDTVERVLAAKQETR